MANDLQQLTLIEKSSHLKYISVFIFSHIKFLLFFLSYLRDFRVEQCQLFLQHKCTQ
jgi:hypothetical protein